MFETKIVKIQWNPEFTDFFNIDINSINLNTDFFDDDSILKKYTMSKEEENLSIIPDRKCITCYYMCYDEKYKIGKEKALENLQKCLVESHCRLPRTDFRGFPQLEC